MHASPPREVNADVAVVGVGLGGYAALLALLERGLTVAAVEEYPWIGGQVSSQALCVLDEYHDPVGEGIGYSRRYGAFRQTLRDHYVQGFRLSSLGKAQLHFNPGNAMNSHMVAEPHVAHRVLLETLRPYRESGRLLLHTGWVAESAECAAYRLKSVTCRPVAGGPERLRLRAAFFLDGTEAGDLYPLIPVSFRLGCDGPVFGEKHAEPQADPGAVQSTTVCFAVEYVPGGRFAVPRPADYEAWKASQGPFMLEAPGATREVPSHMFARRLRADGRMVPPAFYYRSVVDRRNFDDPAVPFSRAIINVGCNDFRGEPLAGSPDPGAVYRKAKALSYAYCHWLQTEAPRDDGGFGYPELRLCPEMTGTGDGFAMAAYIREGRRLCAHRTIVEEDIAVHSQPGSRAEPFADAVGLGGFVIDIHQRTGTSCRFHGGVHTRPYQIPLASLVTPELENFAVAGKCIGTTQITNGAYRLHNIEWAIGEAAGELAAFCLERRPPGPCLSGATLFEYQRRLIAQGVPLFWYEDVGYADPEFEAVQALGIRGIWPASRQHLRFDSHHSVARSVQTVEGAFARLRAAGFDPSPLEEIVLTAHGTRKADVAHRLLRLLDERGWPDLSGAASGAPVPEEDAIPSPLA